MPDARRNRSWPDLLCLGQVGLNFLLCDSGSFFNLLTSTRLPVTCLGSDSGSHLPLYIEFVHILASRQHSEKKTAYSTCD